MVSYISRNHDFEPKISAKKCGLYTSFYGIQNREAIAVSLSFSSSGGETSIVWIVSGSFLMLSMPSIVITIAEIGFCFGSFSELI